MPQSASLHGYDEYEVLDDPGGARAVISKRRDGQLYTVAFARHFEQDGDPRQTSFFKLAHKDSHDRIAVIAWKRLAELQATVGSGSVDRRR